MDEGAGEVVICSQRAWQQHTEDGVSRDGEPEHPAQANSPQRAHVDPGGRLRAGKIPCKCDLLCRRDRRRVHRQLQVTKAGLGLVFCIVMFFV